MSKSELSLPVVQSFDRNVALLAVRALSYNKVHSQPQLLTFFNFTEDYDSELLCAIAAKLDPNREDGRRVLLDMTTNIKFDHEVAMVALDQLFMLNSWKLRRLAYEVTLTMRAQKDLVWHLAQHYNQELSNVYDLDERRG